MLPAPTTRLRFREMTEADLPNIAILEIGGSRGPGGWIAWNRQNYAEHGFGLWVVETPTGEFIGDCGLTMQEVEGEWLVEVGWHGRSALRPVDMSDDRSPCGDRLGGRGNVAWHVTAAW